MYYVFILNLTWLTNRCKPPACNEKRVEHIEKLCETSIKKIGSKHKKPLVKQRDGSQTLVVKLVLLGGR